jgi:hypothetical protein
MQSENRVFGEHGDLKTQVVLLYCKTGTPLHTNATFNSSAIVIGLCCARDFGKILEGKSEVRQVHHIAGALPVT